jgi:hypothetical protein
MKRTILILCLALLSQSAYAMIVRVPLEDMVHSSADIVQGRVLSRESRWNDDRSGIVTKISIAVDQSWAGKSSAGKILTVQTLGGVVDDIGEMVEHEPVFGSSEEVVLFIAADAQGNVRCLNDEQGKFAVGGRYIVGFDLVPHNLASFRQQVGQLLIDQEGPR